MKMISISYQKGPDTFKMKSRIRIHIEDHAKPCPDGCGGSVANFGVLLPAGSPGKGGSPILALQDIGIEPRTECGYWPDFLHHVLLHALDQIYTTLSFIATEEKSNTRKLF